MLCIFICRLVVKAGATEAIRVSDFHKEVQGEGSHHTVVFKI